MNTADVREYAEWELWWLPKHDISFVRQDNSTVLLTKTNLEPADKNGVQKIKDEVTILVLMGKDQFYLDGMGEVKFNTLEEIIEKEFK